MSDEELPSKESSHSNFPVVRQVNTSNVIGWIKAGVKDSYQSGFSSIFYGAFFAVCGWLIQIVLAEHPGLLSGLITGFLLLGPFLAMGLYDLSRQIESGQKPRLTPSLTAWRTNILNVGLFAGLLIAILLIWARASLVIFALFFENSVFPSVADVVSNIITLKNPTFAIVYFTVGGAIAGFVFAISVIAVPLMADRKTDAITAAIASIIACMKNPITMLFWGFSIVVLVGVGLATSYIGLIITMPIVGHATWHVYRDLVAAETTPK